MSEEIKVSVNSAGGGRALSLYWRDPLTGKRKVVSAKTTDPKAAERAAAVLQDELNSGRYASPSRITWSEFRRRFQEEKLSAMPTSSQAAYNVALDHLERVINPDKLAKLTAAVLSRFQSQAREGGMRQTTIARNLRHIKASLRWAERQGLMMKAPLIEMPKLPKSQALMKHRPITEEEFDRLLLAVPKVRPEDSAEWIRVLRGLWLSGLRLSEAVALNWDDGELFAIDLSGVHAVFRILPEGQKSRQPETAPTTPDFIEWLIAEFPEGKRQGRVFSLNSKTTGQPLAPHRVGEIISKIGRKAGVVVGMTDKLMEQGGKKVRKPVKVFATCHDLRRAFCTRWSRRVMPAVLQRLARHANYSTTASYYVASTAEDIGADLWAVWGKKTDATPPTYNNSYNIAQETTQGAGQPDDA